MTIKRKKMKNSVLNVFYGTLSISNLNQQNLSMVLKWSGVEYKNKLFEIQI